MLLILDSLFPLWLGKLTMTWFFGSKLLANSKLFFSNWLLWFWSSARFKFDQFVLIDWPEQLEFDDFGRLFDPRGQYFWVATFLFPFWLTKGRGGGAELRRWLALTCGRTGGAETWVDWVLLEGFVLDLWLVLLLLLQVVPEKFDDLVTAFAEI